MNEHPKYEKAERSLLKFILGTSRISFVGILIIIVITVLDVVLRLTINHTVYGVYNWVCYLMVPIAFFAIPLTTIKREHVGVTVLTDVFPKIIVKILRLLCLLVSLGLTIVFAWKNIDQAAVVNMIGSKPIQLPIKTFWFYYGISAGFILMAVVLVLLIIEAIIKWRDKV